MTFNYLPARADESQQPELKKNPKAAIPLPVEIIREALEIDETVPSGLRWKVRPRHHFERERDWKTWNTHYSSQPAGARWKDSIYFPVQIGGVPFRAHRIVFFLANGTDPAEKHVDHINPLIPLPNIASNLRLATNAENMRNQRKSSRNTSGVPGVGWYKRHRKWRTHIRVHGKQNFLGYFTDLDAAVAARKAAEAKYFGEFSHDASRTEAAQCPPPLFASPIPAGFCVV